MHLKSSSYKEGKNAITYTTLFCRIKTFSGQNKQSRDQLLTSSRANIKVRNFIQRMPFITVLHNTENIRAGGEFEGLILESTVWYEIYLYITQ